MRAPTRSRAPSGAAGRRVARDWAAALSFTLMLFILVGIFLYARVLGARNLTQAAV